MKKLFLLFVFCCFAGAASAQYMEVVNFQYVEAVHLKNGSIIRGVIIEQTPNQNLKIRTGDGNVFAYTSDEIEKITKEIPIYYGIPRKSYNLPPIRIYQETQTPKYQSSAIVAYQEPRTPKYQGSADIAYSVGVGDWRSDRIELSTSHGCLINPYFYFGAGFGVHFHYNADIVTVPIFADFRGNLMKGRIKPFVNLRIGYSVGDIGGLYLSPMVGVSIGRLDIGLGYSLQKMDTYFGSHNNYYEWTEVNLGAVTFKAGIRF